MYIRMCMMAHVALKRYMCDRHAPLDGRTSRRILDAIVMAEEDEGFANLLDHECAREFVLGTALEYDDLVQLFEDPPKGLKKLFRRYKIGKEHRK